MMTRLTLAIALVLGWSGLAQAQEPSGRIDLDVVSSGFPRDVVIRVGFVESDRDCPEERAMLRIWKATLMQLQARLSSDARPASHWQATMQPSDDETQLYRIATPSCRTEIAFRQQVRRDGSWISLLVPRDQRPGVPLEERRELQRQFRENLHSEARTPQARDLLDRQAAADQALRAAGSLGFSYGMILRWPVAFDDRPQTCFEAVGDYAIERTGLRLSFATSLPGDVNRFVIERTEPDSDHGQLSFTRGDCRFELTIGQSVLHDGEWQAVPLAAIPATRG
jgi:hypothetical protein